MPQIPLQPPRNRSHASNGEIDPGTRAGRLRRAMQWFGAPAKVWIGTHSIRDGAAFVGEMVRQARSRAGRDPRFHLTEDGRFDNAATAFSYGVDIPELERRLGVRCRQTAIAAYLLGSIGTVLFLLWLVQVLHADPTPGRVILALEFLPLCAMCVLLGSYQALLNFQIRAGRLESWRGFITTDRGFWPRTWDRPAR